MALEDLLVVELISLFRQLLAVVAGQDFDAFRAEVFELHYDDLPCDFSSTHF